MKGGDTEVIAARESAPADESSGVIDSLAAFGERGSAMGEGVARGEADFGAELGHPLAGDTRF